MLLICDRAKFGVVPVKFAIRMGLVEGQAGPSNDDILLVFCMSYLTFPILTWWLLHESMFTTRTLLCIFLSFCIMGVQFWGR